VEDNPQVCVNALIYTNYLKLANKTEYYSIFISEKLSIIRQSNTKMFSGIQITGVIFVLVMCYFTYLFYVRKDYPKTDYLFWNLIWFLFLVLVLYPYATQPMLEVLGLAMNIHLYTIAGFMIVFVVLFFQHDLLRKNQNKLDKLVRETAIDNAKRKK